MFSVTIDEEGDLKILTTVVCCTDIWCLYQVNRFWSVLKQMRTIILFLINVNVEMLCLYKIMIK